MTDPTTDEPVACTITEETKAEREADIREDLAPHVERIEELDGGGFRLHVAPEPEAVQAMARFVRREHDCCTFAHLELHVTPGDDQNTLTIYGPEGTEDLFREGLVDRLVDEFGADLAA